MDPTTALNAFCFEREARGRAPRTIEKYRYAWQRFIRDVPTADLDTLSEEALLGWFQTMRQRGWKPATINSFGKDVGTFLLWCHKRGWLSFAPPKAPSPPRVDRAIFGQDQLKAMLAIAERGRNRFRNVAIFKLLLGTGLRVSEVAHLELGDVDFQGGLVHVRAAHAKSRVSRVVPLGHAARAAVYEYVAFGRGGSTQPRLFLAEDGAPLGMAGIQRMLKRLGRRAGVPWARAHLFRHTYATASVLAGTPLPALQTFLGHENLRTTGIYMNHAALQATAVAYSRTPADILLGGSHG